MFWLPLHQYQHEQHTVDAVGYIILTVSSGCQAKDPGSDNSAARRQ
jgi:hypothetical protein